MSKSATVHARIEPETKKKAEGVLKKLGISPTEAIRIFYKQICLRGGLPFPVLIPNETTKKTLEKSSRGEDIQSFNSLEEMFDSWEK
ncbi:MAG: type II toxin-antitoxin system RelB/DinJ family antitoxin [Candidatus Kuenenia sp.]|nr:type II toxin-antitoxin system RelB/DinJ family antitoxin [Candidatus Kuenenia hertensis]